MWASTNERLLGRDGFQKVETPGPRSRSWVCAEGPTADLTYLWIWAAGQLGWHADRARRWGRRTCSGDPSGSGTCLALFAEHATAALVDKTDQRARTFGARFAAAAIHAEIILI